MSKHHHDDDDDIRQDKHYHHALRSLQIELVKLQRRLIADGSRVLIILEGRDSAGKDGTIRRLTKHMSPRDTRVHAPGKPSSREETQWYFQRFIPFLPSGGEFVVFNRSWYNRSGVERVMDFCTKEQTEAFLESVVPLEAMLTRDGLEIRKYYLDITRKEQKQRLKARDDSPLKKWKISPVDAVAQKKWDSYSKWRDITLERTSHPAAPWRVIASDTKQIARLELLRDMLSSFDYPGKSKKLTQPDRNIAFVWKSGDQKRLAH